MIEDIIDAGRCCYCGDLVLDAERTAVDWNDVQTNQLAHSACAGADEDVRYAANE